MRNFSRSSGSADWLQALCALPCSAVSASVLITVKQTRGSAPRAAGTKMLVMGHQCVGTIGGGHLEFRTIESAHKLLTDANASPRYFEKIPLGPSLGQCCGGMVELMYERISNSEAPWIQSLGQCFESEIPAVIVTSLNNKEQVHQQDACKLIVTESDCYGELMSSNPDGTREVQTQSEEKSKAVLYARELLSNRALTAQHEQDDLLYELTSSESFHLMLFGAGHVGQAVVSVLQALSCRITWIDSREELFPESLPNNVTVVTCDEPEEEIDSAPPGTYVLIMTHNHQLDLKICEQALQKINVSFCGLIGSSSKNQRFRKRLLARGLGDKAVNRLVCPIGIDSISGKEPGVIAIAVAAQLQQLVENEVLRCKDSKKSALACKQANNSKIPL